MWPWPGTQDHSLRRRIEDSSIAKVRATQGKLLHRPTAVYFSLAVPLFFGLIFVPFFFDVPFNWWSFVWVVPALMVYGWARVLRSAMACELARAYVLAGLCASCGYKLETQVVAEDDCCVCSECGAAWKVC